MNQSPNQCQCDLKQEMAWAGPAAQLCQHSPAEKAEEVAQHLINLLSQFTEQISSEDMKT